VDSLKTADELLTIATRLLDEAAQIFSTSEMPERREQISRIGKSLASAFQAQQAIYAVRPELEPEWLKAPSPHPEENREYGRMFISAIDLWEAGHTAAALEQWRSYIAAEHPEPFRGMAIQQLRIFEAALRGDGAA
jgi:hypothetical protein